MKENRIILKKSPKLEFVFDDESLEIINDADKNTGGVYEYSQIINYEYSLNRINWIVTILGSLIHLIFGDLNTEVSRDKKKLHLKTVEKKITINLFDCEQSKIAQLLNKLETKLTKTST